MLQTGYAGFIKLIETPDYSKFQTEPYSVYKDPVWKTETRKNKVELERVAFYHCDQVGTPQTLSNELGECIWEIKQDTWGTALEINESENLLEQTNLRFQGQYYDKETNLHYNRYRYYEPHSARYVSKDPIGLEGGFNNLAYVSDPNQWVDPMGLMAKDIYKAPEGSSPWLQPELDKLKIADARGRMAAMERDMDEKNKAYKKLENNIRTPSRVIVSRGVAGYVYPENDKPFKPSVIAISAGGDSSAIKGYGASSSIYLAQEKNGVFVGSSGTRSKTIGTGGSLGAGIDWYDTDISGFTGRADTSETCAIIVCFRVHQNSNTKQKIGYGVSPLTEVGGGFTHHKADTQLYHKPVKISNKGK